MTSDVIEEVDTPDVRWRVLDLGMQGWVVQVEGRILLVGTDNDPGATGAVWASTDGVEWEVLGELMDPSIQAGRVGILGVSRFGSSVAAWGWYEPAGTDDTVSAAWVSLDGGVTWSMPDLPGVVHVVPTAEGFFAIGFDQDTASVFTNDRTAWVRTSADGVDWELLFESEDPEGFGSVMSRGVWHDGLVVLGTQSQLFQPDEDTPSIPDDWPHIPSVWLDGSTSPVETNHPGGVWWLFSTHWGIVGVVRSSQLVWTSPTGVAWHSFDLGDRWRSTGADYANETLYVSAVRRHAGEAPGIEEAAIWVSADGLTWRSIAVPEEMWGGMDLSVEESRVVLVGISERGVSRLAIGTLASFGD